MTTEGEEAAFEAGIKLGALYHQWVGTPISKETADTVERAIERSVSLQPHVVETAVRLRRELMVPNRFGYTELRGEMFDVRIVTRVGNAVCHATLSLEDGYPMMQITEIGR
ncbi:MAG: dihydroneopterin aldolase family protein [Methanomicrobiales archaeon]|jgi:hypothetical protein|nr:dihydroneopterin aldolase family protein [Methanomicrobiales archaeon]